MSFAMYKVILISFFQYFAVMTLIYILIIRPLEKKWQRTPNEKIAEYGFDLRYTLFHYAANTLLVSPIFWMFKPIDQYGFLSHVLQPLPLWFQFILAIVTWDFLYYGLHRFSHNNKYAWPLHKSHHSSEKLHVLAGHRANIFSSVTVQSINFLVMNFVGFSPKIALAFSGVYLVINTFIHLDSRLRFGFLENIIATPHFHIWHHADPPEQKNLAVFFPFIDMLFGTFYLPKDVPKKIGLGDDAIRSSVWYHQFQPFFDWKAFMMQKKSRLNK